MRGHLELAPAGTSERIDEIRKLVEAGILQAVSVGFHPLEKEPMDDKADKYFGPFKYLKQELRRNLARLDPGESRTRSPSPSL